MSSSKQVFLFEVIRFDPIFFANFLCISLFTQVSFNAQLKSGMFVSFNPPSIISFSKNELSILNLLSHKKFDKNWSILFMIFWSGFGKTVKKYTTLGSASVLTVQVALPIIDKLNLLYKLNNFSVSKIFVKKLNSTISSRFTLKLIPNSLKFLTQFRI